MEGQAVAFGDALRIFITPPQFPTSSLLSLELSHISVCQQVCVHRFWPPPLNNPALTLVRTLLTSLAIPAI